MDKKNPKKAKEKKYQEYHILIPVHLAKPLNEEADCNSRTYTAQFRRILEERYKLQ